MMITTELTPLQFIAWMLLLGWLFAESFWDIRNRNIPRWFSIIPLASGLVYLGVTTQWYAAALVTLSVGVTSVSHPALRRFVMACLLLVMAFIPELRWLLAGWALLYLDWELGWMGGADALAGLYLLAWFPIPKMVVSLFLGTLIWTSAIAITRFRRDVGLKIWTTVSTCAAGTHIPNLGSFLVSLMIVIILVLR